MTKEDLQAIRQIMQEELKPINERLTKIEVKIENETDRAIKTIGEGHLDLNQKLIEKISLDNRVEMLEHKVSALEYVVKK